MKITTTRKFDLKVHQEEFEIQFAYNRKNGVPSDKDHWFTPTGKCKLYIGAMYINHVGDTTKKVHETLIKLMKKNKSEVLTDGRDYFTTTGSKSLAEINNMSIMLYQARNEWEKRKYIEFWVEDDRDLKLN